MRVGGHPVRDEHNNHLLSITQILAISSNVGVTKMILSLPPHHLWGLLHRVGFGEVTGTGFPGERSGMLPNPTEWKPFALATLAFGYSLSVTPLQLAEAYSVLANDGVKLPVSLLRVESPPQGTRVMDAKVAKEMLKLLELVVSEKGATGSRARIQGYRVAGKTGTSFIAGPNGYDKTRYISSFVGIAPVSHPRFVVAVIIREPKGKDHHGGFIAAPIFKKVMEGTLHILNVPPDGTA
jgi:cell division protein FtsI (penicillin-binding protein 3)